MSDESFLKAQYILTAAVVLSLGSSNQHFIGFLFAVNMSRCIHPNAFITLIGIVNNRTT